MSEARIEMLAVRGARLYTETRGSGPLLVCIVGGNGDPEVFAQMASRVEIAVTFLALLELIRLKQVRASQPNPFDEIEIAPAS